MIIGFSYLAETQKKVMIIVTEADVDECGLVRLLLLLLLSFFLLLVVIVMVVVLLLKLLLLALLIVHLLLLLICDDAVVDGGYADLNVIVFIIVMLSFRNDES